MTGKLTTETLAGLVVLALILILAYISIRLGDVSLGEWGYAVYADFPTAGGLQEGAVVELAGVEVGRVEAVELNDYQARVRLKIRKDLRLPEDSIVAIKSKGLIGEKFVRIEPGQAENMIPPGGYIRKTEPPVDIQDVIGGFIFGNMERQPSNQDQDLWSLELE